MCFYQLLKMNIKRLKVVLLHSWYHLIHSLETLFGVILIPIMQFLVFGFISLYFIKDNAQAASYVLLGYLLWIIIQIAQHSVTVAFLWEIWSRSFSNLFITPLTIDEFLAGQMISGTIKALTVFLFSSLLGILIFKFNIFKLGILLIIIFIELLVFAWSTGIFVLGLIFRHGTDIQALAWGMIFFLQPITAAFYPVSILPVQIRFISYFFPATHFFELAREYFSYGTLNTRLLLTGTVINIIFFGISYFFMRKMLERSKKLGTFTSLES